jgi:hypothetical protein
MSSYFDDLVYSRYNAVSLVELFPVFSRNVVPIFKNQADFSLFAVCYCYRQFTVNYYSRDRKRAG